LLVSEGRTDIRKKLVHVEFIAISGSRSAVAAFLKATLEFREQPEVLSGVDIAVKHVPLQQIAIVILRACPPVRVIEILVSLAEFSSQRQPRRTVSVQRDELPVIERAVPQCRIAER
jgi:hypothetical protein